jgi:poly(hydroxyalkanoate) depolymerase family esterase
VSRRKAGAVWARALTRSWATLTRLTAAAGTRAVTRALKPARAARASVRAVDGTWTPGLALGTAGARRFRLYRPPGVHLGDRRPLVVMLHGCGQDAEGFAASTRMNRIALREGFLVLYPEQDRRANAQGCWNWFDTGNGRAQGEAALILQAIDQVGLLHPVDPARVALVGLSAGASMAALLATRHPARFAALVMHSGVPPGAAHSTLSALGAMRGRVAPPAADEPADAPAHTAWPPLLVIHGQADGVVASVNGDAAARAWAQATGARAGPARRVQRGRRHAMTVTDFSRGGRTVVSLVAVEGLAHAWSGGVASQPFGDGDGPDASRLAWTFMARQFRAAA